MGTNYYAIPKASPENEKEYKKLADEKDWQTLASKLHQLESIHIGKSSVGWQFIFDHNNWEYFPKEEKTIIGFINNCKIFDEYDRAISIDDFWKLVRAKKDGLDNKAYYLKHPDQQPLSHRQCDDIYVGELLFSPNIDFS